MPVIIFSPKASEDLDSIKAYIESELGSPQAANEKVLEILDAIDNLAIFPETLHIKNIRRNKAIRFQEQEQQKAHRY
jgi:plasmid stabilization system protein ParE